jgi:hypothetical protein
MAPLFQPLTVSGPFGQYTSQALVDPGSIFVSVPAPALIEMGIEPVRVVRLRDAAGSPRFHQHGRALVTLEAQEEVMPVLFGEPGSPAVIGSAALTLLLLEVSATGDSLVALTSASQLVF